MEYEFWDSRPYDLNASFESEHEAIEVLRDMIGEEGERTLEFLMIIYDDSCVLGIE